MLPGSVPLSQIFFFRWIARQWKLPEVLTEPLYNCEGLRQSVLPKGSELQNLLFPSFHRARISWPIGHAKNNTFFYKAFLGNWDEWLVLGCEQNLVFGTFIRFYIMPLILTVFYFTCILLLLDRLVFHWIRAVNNDAVDHCWNCNTLITVLVISEPFVSNR